MSRSDIKDIQRNLKTLLKTDIDSSSFADPYLRQVATSPELQILRDSIRWWRRFDIERVCPLTTRLLKQKGTFEEILSVFIRNGMTTAYIEQIGEFFLESLLNQEDLIIRSVVCFELALLKVRNGSTENYIVDFPEDPYIIIDQILYNRTLTTVSSGHPHRVLVSANIEKLFRVLPN